MEENIVNISDATAKLLLTSVIAAGSALWGWFGWLVILWMVCMVLDYATGTLAAIKKGDWSSAVARAGLWHKAGMIFVVLIASLSDFALTLILRTGVVELPVTYSIALTVIVLAWYTLTELGSALENATKLTDQTPAWLTKFLRITAAKVNDLGEKIAGGQDDEKQP